MKHSPRSQHGAEELHSRLAEHSLEELRVRRRLRVAFLVAVAVHFVLFCVNIPSAQQTPDPDPVRAPILHLVSLPTLQPPEPTIPQVSRDAAPVPIPVPAPVDAEIEPMEPAPPIQAPAVEGWLEQEPIITPLPPPPQPAVTHPVVVGGAVLAPRKLHDVVPEYPPVARKAHRQGTVILQVLLDTDGAVSDIQVLRPEPLGLTEAAVEAVRQWRYEPVLLCGRPVEAIMTVTVQFRLQ